MSAAGPEGETLHVLPSGNIPGHQEDYDCPCSPPALQLETPFGKVRWIAIHLDPPPAERVEE